MSNKLHIAFDSSKLLYQHSHGTHVKDQLIFHETISHDEKGLADILGVENYLAQKDFGIHGMVDAEGNIAWAKGLGDAIFWQCGGDNTRSIGIELVSNIPSAYRTNLARRNHWKERTTQLNAAAKLAACIHRAHPNIVMVYTKGIKAGITSHWNISQIFPASEGHTDCWPVNEGGYFPLLRLIGQTRLYYKEGWKF